ncbi:MAG: hypothetical protein GY720_21960 [bacterium]|nr:hypothetical protein [bacterium]
MSSFTSLWLILGGVFISAVVVSYRKGRRAAAVLSVFMMMASLVWLGLLIMGIGRGYPDDEYDDYENPTGVYTEESRPVWEVAALIAIGAGPGLVSLVIPLTGAIRPALPNSKFARKQIPPPAHSGVEPTRIPPPKAPEAGNRSS